MIHFSVFFSVVIVCASASETGKAILAAIDHLHLARDHNTLTIFLDVSSLPSWLSTINYYNNETALINMVNSSQITVNNTLDLLDKISFITKRYVLVFSENVIGDLSSNYTYNVSVEGVLVCKIKRALLALSGERNEDSNFILLDITDEGSWRPLLAVTRSNYSDFSLNKILDNLDEWTLKHKHNDECEGCENELTKLTSVLIILGCSFVFVSVLLGLVALARNQLLKKKLSKGPYKVLLTATDFVFPQLADSRRVSENVYLHLFKSKGRN